MTRPLPIAGRLRRGAAVATLAALVAAAPAAAGVLNGERFEKTVALTDTRLALYDLALMRRWIFDVYVAGLYLEPGTPGERVLADVPKRLEIAYLRGFSAEQLRQAGTEILRRNVDAETFERLGPKIDAINALYRDVEAGDRYALDYEPGLGTSLRLNDELLGRIEGVEFGRAVFSIWLGDEPFDAALKGDLLDGA